MNNTQHNTVDNHQHLNRMEYVILLMLVTPVARPSAPHIPRIDTTIFTAASTLHSFTPSTFPFYVGMPRDERRVILKATCPMHLSVVCLAPVSASALPTLQLSWQHALHRVDWGSC